MLVLRIPENSPSWSILHKSWRGSRNAGNSQMHSTVLDRHRRGIWPQSSKMRGHSRKYMQLVGVFCISESPSFCVIAHKIDGYSKYWKFGNIENSHQRVEFSSAANLRPRDQKWMDIRIKWPIYVCVLRIPDCPEIGFTAHKRFY